MRPALPTYNRIEPTAILAYVVTFPCGYRRAKFTMPRQTTLMRTPAINDCVPLTFFR